MSAFYKAFANGSPAIEGVPDRIIDTLIDNLTLTAGLQRARRPDRRASKFSAPPA